MLFIFLEGERNIILVLEMGVGGLGGWGALIVSLSVSRRSPTYLLNPGDFREA